MSPRTAALALLCAIASPCQAGSDYVRLEQRRDEAARECLAHETSDVVTRKTPLNSAPAEPAADGHFPAAQVRSFDELPRLWSLLSISPNGRWVVYNSFDAKKWIFYSVADDTVSSMEAETSSHPWLKWSDDGQHAQAGNSNRRIALSQGKPVPDPASAFIPGPCFEWDEYQAALHHSVTSSPLRDWVVPPSPREITEYELVHLNDDLYGVRAKGTPDARPVYVVDLAHVKHEELDYVDSLAADLRKDPAQARQWLYVPDPLQVLKAATTSGAKLDRNDLKMLEDLRIEYDDAKAHPAERLEKLIDQWRSAAQRLQFGLMRTAASPTGRYLYVELYVNLRDLPNSGKPLSMSRYVVLDLQAQPSRGWELKGGDAHWHPNGHELYFTVPTGEVDQLQRQKLSLAVARFP